MATLTNPTPAEVRDFILKGEGNRSTGMYNDDSIGHYPTHGLGINFSGKTRVFIEAYINSLGSKVPPEARFSIDTPVDHYIYNGTLWVIDETAGKKSLIDEIIWLCKTENTAHQPFQPISGIPTDDPIRMATDPEINKQAFDEIVYDAYLNSKYDITGIISNVGSEIWNKLDKNERLALYSLNYNAGSLIGSNLKSALFSYINGSSDENKMLGKLRAWYEILYASNGGGDKKGVQNRRFMEADAFLGDVHDKIEEGKGENNSIIHVNNFAEANATIAFMNKFSEQMINYMGDISEYKKRKYEIVRNNFREAITTFMNEQNYTGGYNINTLFTEWNLYTDLHIDTSTGHTIYGDVTGSSSRDLIFITGDIQGTHVNAKDGDDFVSGSSKKDVIYAGKGNDVIYTYGGDDEVYTTDGKSSDYNQVYLGAGSDTFRGGDGDDFVDGGSGKVNSLHVRDANETEDTELDINVIDLGGGQNRYIGGKGKDKVQGTGYNTVYLGAGSDEYIGGDGVDIVDGGSQEDAIFNHNTIHLGGGNNRYIGGIGIDEVTSGSGNDYINAGNGDNVINSGAGNDHIIVGDGNDRINTGTGSDYISAGGGNNTIYTGMVVNI